MAQNRTIYQAGVTNTIYTNTTGDVSGDDVQIKLKGLSDSVRHANNLLSALGTDPTTWNTEGYEQRYASCSITANLSMTLSNTTTTGDYVLYVIKNTASDLTATFDDSTTTVTVRYPNAASNFKMTGASGSTFTFLIQRLAGTLIVRCEDGILDEDDFASNSATQAPSQQSVKAYVDNRTDIVDSSTTAIAFDKGRKYGYPTAETGNITYDFTNAIDGVTQVLRHNSGTAPTIPASTIVLAGSYTVSVNNYIYLTAINTAAEGSTPVWEVHLTYSQKLN